jgi:adenylate cyclase
VVLKELHPMQIRISLDSGPCYSYKDTIVNRLEFCGDYVIRAARMETVTPQNQIYASETFVAMALALGIDKSLFHYAGIVILPKNKRSLPVHLVQFEKLPHKL